MSNRKPEEVDHIFIFKTIRKLLPTIHGFNSIEVFKETPSILNNVYVSMWRMYQKGTFKCQLIESTYEEWKGYLYLTIKNEVYGVLNTIKAARLKSELTYSIQEDEDSFLHPTTNDNTSRLQDLLDHFNPKEKEIVVLLMEGYKKKEIAQLFNLEKNSLSSRLRRIKDKIIQLGLGRGYDLYNNKSSKELQLLDDADIIYKSKAITEYGLKNQWAYRKLIRDLKPIDKSKYQFEKKILEVVYWHDEFLKIWNNSKGKTT